MKVLTFLQIARLISTLDPNVKLDISVKDDVFTVSCSETPEFYVSTKLDIL